MMLSGSSNLFGSDGSGSPLFAGCLPFLESTFNSVAKIRSSHHGKRGRASFPPGPLTGTGLRGLSAEHTTGIDWRKANGTKDHPVWASVPIATEPNKYDLSVLLALNPIKVYESIISSGIAGTEYGRLPWLALSVMSGHTSNAASEGCHSIAQLIMSDLQTSMGDGILQMIVCLRDGKEAVEQLKAMYPEEAKNVALSRHQGFRS